MAVCLQNKHLLFASRWQTWSEKSAEKSDLIVEKCDILKHVETLLIVNWLTDPLPKQYVPMLSFYKSENTVGVHVIQT